MEGAWVAPASPIIEGWYDGNGIPLGGVDYAHKKTSTLGAGWTYRVMLSTTAEKTTIDQTADLSGAAPGSGGVVSYFGGFEPSNTVAANDNLTVLQSTARTFSPLNNDVDGNGDPLNITNVSTPAHGTATFSAANGTMANFGWLNWSVIVPANGTYQLTVTSAAGGSLRLSADDRLRRELLQQLYGLGVI